ncbi:type II secretion system F family protein [Roseateles sp. DC23W]|uniref:Type II secretion system F family protein n=1 Tax=Pelomonas dachongensis TaxID=3299029 RepID=A0ABW7EGL7_9BURK
MTWLFLLCAAGCVSLLIYAVLQLYRQLGRSETVYRDRPPRGFELLWPLVNIMANSFGSFMSEARRAALLARLKRAGQEYSLTPEQFLGGKLVSAIGFALVGLVLASESAKMVGVVLGALLGFMYPDIWLRDHTLKRNLLILKSLPFFLDIVTLSVEAGMNLSGALQKAVDRCPPGPLLVEVNRVLRDVRGGKPRVEALRAMADRLDYSPVSSLVSALVQGELMGSSLGPVLRAQSDQRRTERFLRAEKLAMEAPVKMLGPLIMFIFPCTFIVLGFPIVMKFMASGL